MSRDRNDGFVAIARLDYEARHGAIEPSQH